MVIRTYFDKNNTIIYNSLTNTARNSVTEIFYGSDNYSDELQYSRYIFHFNESRLKDFFTGGTMPIMSAMTHTLKLTNTGFFDSELLNSQNSSGKDRASSFDLIVFRINQDWDEGCGYDFDTANLSNNSVTSTAPSNWVEARTLTNWSGGTGVYSGSPSGITVGTQHFDQGNENLEIDITGYVNGLLTGNTNYGLGIAYSRALEQTPTSELQYVGFFTRHSQTAYVPIIETIYNKHITDNRSDFYMDVNNKLYLYVNVGGVATNLDSLPTVKVYDNDDVLFSSYTTTAVTHITKGVYSINLKVPDNGTYTSCDLFSDIWSGITIGGISRPNAELQFSLKDSLGYYNVGDTNQFPTKVGFTLSNLNFGEKMIADDIRKVIVSVRHAYTVNQTVNVASLKYRLYIKEGQAQYTIIDFQEVERANNYYYFLLDTASLMPNKYYIDLLLTENQEVTRFPEATCFEVVNQSEMRESQ